MEDMSPVNDEKAAALALGKLIQEHRGIDVVVMDLREQCVWTNFFVVATVTSHTHVQGLLRHIREFTAERNIEILHGRRKASPDDEWNLVDLGTTVIHLMTAKSRSFYELERLWSAAPTERL
ncbi:MAG: ribosome silencing factor [Spirochaetaceae bacterium]|jgi:ribosome-associated protein|nr:ribosome silencing factor [Spirochaetaceae bacterium]